jgi:hypothetical protein
MTSEDLRARLGNERLSLDDSLSRSLLQADLSKAGVTIVATGAGCITLVAQRQPQPTQSTTSQYAPRQAQPANFSDNKHTPTRSVGQGSSSADTSTPVAEKPPPMTAPGKGWSLPHESRTPADELRGISMGLIWAIAAIVVVIFGGGVEPWTQSRALSRAVVRARRTSLSWRSSPATRFRSRPLSVG